jgi:hypothetical protein
MVVAFEAMATEDCASVLGLIPRSCTMVNDEVDRFFHSPSKPLVRANNIREENMSTLVPFVIQSNLRIFNLTKANY